MNKSQQQSSPAWETKVLKVANSNAVLSTLFYLLYEEGHFSTDADTLRAGLGFDNPRDQAIFDALKDFVANIPPPDMVSVGAPMGEFLDATRRINGLIPGVSGYLTDVITGNPGYMYSTWPHQFILAAQAELGWAFVSKEPIVEDGLSVGTAYTFRRRVEEQ